jgi:branched-chain amino acid transport system ATP-binding protein
MLEIKGLSQYFGGLAALNGFDLTIRAGELVGLIGPNGAGKTTLFNVITGFFMPTGGKIVFEGDDVTGKKPHAIAARGIIRTFQSTTLFPDFTVLQNVVAGCHLKPRVGFWEAALHLPGSRKKHKDALARAMEILKFIGLDGAKDTRAASLAYGHQRVLGIGIALAADPKLLLLDEPLCGMNASEVNDAKALITKIWQNGTALLLIEHNMEATMTLCRRIAVLNFGNKIAEGTPEQISRDENVIRAYLGSAVYAA